MFYSSKYTKLGIGLVFLLGFLGKIKAQNLSFKDAYDTMYKDNNALKAINKQSESQQFLAKSLQSLRLPTVNAFAAGMVFDKKSEISFNKYRDGLANLINLPNPELLGNWMVPVGKKEMGFAGFNALWPVFTGGKINAAIKAGEIENKILKHDVEITENRLISELAQRYFQVKLADEALRVRQQLLEGMQKHQYNATKLEENGIIAPTEKLVADVAVSEANRELLAAQKNTQLARTALANTLDKDTIDHSLSTPFFTNIVLHKLQVYKEDATRNYPELKKILLQKQLADQGVAAKKSNFFPDVALFGQTVLLHNDPIGFGILDSSREKPWVIGVGVTYNIFSGMRHKNELKAAESLRKSMDFVEAKAQKDITTLVEGLYYEIQKSQEEIHNLAVQEKLAQELLRSRTKAFTEGLATSTDVVDAENGLSLIKLLILNAKFVYITSFATLLEFCGQSKEFLKYTY